MPQVGILNVNGMTIAEATSEIRAILSRGYENPEVSLLVREYHNNKAFVLGRVSEPGVVNFPGDGTLLEALALAGGLPHIGKDTFLTKCAIIRDNDTVIWIDLRDLLDHGNMALNAKILNNDVIFIPEAEDEMVLVLGEVRQAGPVMLKRGLNIIDALMRSGGYTEEADLETWLFEDSYHAVGDLAASGQHSALSSQIAELGALRRGEPGGDGAMAARRELMTRLPAPAPRVHHTEFHPSASRSRIHEGPRTLMNGTHVAAGLLIAAALVTYGAFGAMKDAGLELPTADDFKSGNDN